MSSSWSDREVMELRLAYGVLDGGNFPLDEFSARIGKSPEDVMRKAVDLGLPERAEKRAAESGSRLAGNAPAWLSRAQPALATAPLHTPFEGRPEKGKGTDLPAWFSRASTEPATASPHIPFEGRSKKGKRADLGDMFFRSRWEANYARYLNLLITQKKIASWEYESQTFWFESIKRGTRSYTPDFKVHSLDGSYEWHEVKGRMDRKSLTRLKRMKKYYPHERIVVIGQEWFAASAANLSGVLPGWETARTETPRGRSK